MTTEKETHSPASAQGDWKPEKDWEGLQVNEGLQAVTDQETATLNQRPGVKRIKTVQFESGHAGAQVTPVETISRHNGTWMRLEDDKKDGRRVLGLRAPIFWMLVVVFVLVLSGAIGGGVAASLSAQTKATKKQTTASQFTGTSFSAPTAAGAAMSSASMVASTSTYAAAAPEVSPALSSPCDGSSSANGSIITATDTSGIPGALNRTPHEFKLVCNTNYPAGANFGNPKLVDLMAVYPSPQNMQGCVNACIQYNLGSAVVAGSPSCKAVAITKSPGGWCFFKSAVGVNDTSSSAGVSTDAAILLGV